MGWIILGLLLVIALLIIVSCVKVVPQSKAYVVERLGVYLTTYESGLHFMVPFIDRVSKHVNLREQVFDFPPQPVITKDNVTMRIDSVVYFFITDPKMYAYGVENPIAAIENLTATTLRNIIGSMDLDITLTSRDIINTQMRAQLDEATDPWGIKVTRVELKNILPPDSIQEAMEKQMKAEREKREAIRLAEGKKQSAILIAEGNKEAAILQAEAEKRTAILRAEAEKERRIREAEGEAEAIMKVKQAEADGYRMVKQAEAEGIQTIRQAGADERVLQLRGLEALEEMARGKATKLIVPSELQNLTGLLASLKESVKDGGSDLYR